MRHESFHSNSPRRIHDAIHERETRSAIENFSFECDPLGIPPANGRNGRFYRPSGRIKNRLHVNPTDTLISVVEESVYEIRVVPDTENVATPEDINRRLSEQDRRVMDSPWSKLTPEWKKYRQRREFGSNQKEPFKNRD